MTFAEMKDRIRTAIYSEWKHSDFSDRYRAEKTLNFAANIFDTRKEPAQLKMIVEFLAHNEYNYIFPEYEEITAAYSRVRTEKPFCGVMLRYDTAKYNNMITAMNSYLQEYSQIYSEYRHILNHVSRHFDTLGDHTHDFTAEMRILHDNDIFRFYPNYWKEVFNLMCYAYIKGIKAERARRKRAVNW